MPSGPFARARLLPARRRGMEHLDVPGVEPALQRRSLRDVALANRLFGGTRAVLGELERVLPALPAVGATLLDVGTGLGDIPARAARMAARRGIRLTTLGLDAAEALARSSRAVLHAAMVGDVRRLPFADGSVDVVTCSQVLHHFADADAVAVLRELDRVARVAVIVSDLRRSWLAAAGIWAASFPLGFHPVSRHDGVLSVLRGFTAAELAHHVVAATDVTPHVRHRLGWRVTARWTPGGGGAAIGT